MKKLLLGCMLLMSCVMTSFGYVKLRIDSNDEILGVINAEFAQTIKLSTGSYFSLMTATSPTNGYTLMFSSGIYAPYGKFDAISSTGAITSPHVIGTIVTATSLLEAYGTTNLSTTTVSTLLDTLNLTVTGTINFPAQSIQGADIKDNEVTSQQLADTITVTGLTATTIGTGDITVTYGVNTATLTVTNSLDFPSQSVQGADIKNNEITSTQLADDITVTTLASGGITNTYGIVTATLTVTNSLDFPGQSVQGADLVNNSVTSTQLADDVTVSTITVTNQASITNLTVSNLIDFPAQSLQGADIKNNEITSAQLADEVTVTTLTVGGLATIDNLNITVDLDVPTINASVINVSTLNAYNVYVTSIAYGVVVSTFIETDYIYPYLNAEVEMMSDLVSTYGMEASSGTFNYVRVNSANGTPAVDLWDSGVQRGYLKHDLDRMYLVGEAIGLSLQSNGGDMILATDTTYDFDVRASTTNKLQIGDGIYSWTHNPNVGIEGTLEVDSYLYVDGWTYLDDLLVMHSADLQFSQRGGAGENVISGNRNAYILAGSPTLNDKNFDHGIQTDPTLFIQSAQNPDTDNTQWFSMSYSSANDRAEFNSGGPSFDFSKLVTGVSLQLSSYGKLNNDVPLYFGTNASKYRMHYVAAQDDLWISMDGISPEFRVLDSSAVAIGNAGTINYATGQGDLYVQDALEVDGNSYYNNTANFASTVYVNSGLFFADDIFPRFGTDADYTMGYATTQNEFQFKYGGAYAGRLWTANQFGLNITTKTVIMSDKSIVDFSIDASSVSFYDTMYSSQIVVGDLGSPSQKVLIRGNDYLQTELGLKEISSGQMANFDVVYPDGLNISLVGGGNAVKIATSTIITGTLNVSSNVPTGFGINVGNRTPLYINPSPNNVVVAGSLEAVSINATNLTTYNALQLNGKSESTLQALVPGGSGETYYNTTMKTLSVTTGTVANSYVDMLPAQGTLYFKSNKSTVDFSMNDSSATFYDDLRLEGHLYPRNIFAKPTGSTAFNYYLLASPDQQVNLQLLSSAAGSNNAFVISNGITAYARNFDHPVQTNPTLFIHSSTDPDTNNTQWVSFTHDQSSGVITTGAGGLSLNPAGDVLVPTTQLIVGNPSSIPAHDKGLVVEGNNQYDDIYLEGDNVVGMMWRNNWWPTDSYILANSYQQFEFKRLTTSGYLDYMRFLGNYSVQIGTGTAAYANSWGDLYVLNDLEVGKRVYASSITVTGQFSTPYAQTITVAKNGGDFTSINSAVASITDASATKRYLVQVMPGTYDEYVLGKSFVDLVGANKHTTYIVQTDSNVVVLANDELIQNFTIQVATATAARIAIVYQGNINQQNNWILDNIILLSSGNYASNAIGPSNYSSKNLSGLYIERNYIVGVSTNFGYGIYVGGAAPDYKNVYINNNVIRSVQYGVNCYVNAPDYNSTITLKNNDIIAPTALQLAPWNYAPGNYCATVNTYNNNLNGLVTLYSSGGSAGIIYNTVNSYSDVIAGVSKTNNAYTLSTFTSADSVINTYLDVQNSYPQLRLTSSVSSYYDLIDFSDSHGDITHLVATGPNFTPSGVYQPDSFYIRQYGLGSIHLFNWNAGTYGLSVASNNLVAVGTGTVSYATGQGDLFVQDAIESQSVYTSTINFTGSPVHAQVYWDNNLQMLVFTSSITAPGISGGGGSGGVAYGAYYTVGTASGSYTGSQTVFNLPFIYAVDGKSLQVFYNGVMMTPVDDYTETNGSVVTFVSNRTLGSKVSFRTVLATIPGSPVASNYIAGWATGTYNGSLTHFDLPFTYAANKNSLFVFNDGILMKVDDDYVETSPTEVTFSTARSSGSYVTFRTNVGTGWVGVAGSSLTMNSYNVSLSTGSKIYFDGAGGNDYIYNSANDVMRFAVAGSNKLSVSNYAGGWVSVDASSFSIDSDKALYLDGGGDTYIKDIGNIMRFYTGGAEQLRLSAAQVLVNASNLLVDSTYKLYLDGGSDTYISEYAANTIGMYTGGNPGIIIANNQDVVMQSTKKLYLDGGGDSYIQHSAANEIDFACAGQYVAFASSNTNGGRFSVQPGVKLGLDGGGDTYITEALNSPNEFSFFAGNTEALHMTATRIFIPAASRLYFDGGGNDYMSNGGGDSIDCYMGGNIAFTISSAASYWRQSILSSAAHYNLGSAADYWQNCYAASYPAVSRKSLKKDITYKYPVISTSTFTTTDYDNLPQMATFHYNDELSTATLHLGYMLNDDNETDFGNLPYVYKNGDNVNEVSDKSLIAYLMALVQHLNKRVEVLEAK